jgi:hypothetical protein
MSGPQARKSSPFGRECAERREGEAGEGARARSAKQLQTKLDYPLRATGYQPRLDQGDAGEGNSNRSEAEAES